MYMQCLDQANIIYIPKKPDYINIIQSNIIILNKK